MRSRYPSSSSFAYSFGPGPLTPAIKAKLREMEGGQVLEVRVDDPSAHEDITVWCRLAGHDLLAVVDEMPKYTRYFLGKKRG